MEKDLEPIKSLAIANWFLEKAWRCNLKITAIRLQKLVYFTHGWHLALYNEPLTDELPQAWSWGPVFPDIYDVTKKYGSQPIYEHVSETTIQSDDTRIHLLEKVWKIYNKYSDVQLSSLAREDGSWHITRKKYPNRRNVSIDDDTIEQAFKDKIQLQSSVK